MEPFKFNGEMRRFFRADAGAGSIVTEKDEARKSQITITKFENQIISSYFGSIPKGSKTSLEKQGVSAEAKFRLYPTGDSIDLVLLHPKPARTELRIYMKADVFKPIAGLVWFVFLREGDIWIGALDEYSIVEILSGKTKTANQETLIDFSDDEFQSAFQSDIVPETIEQTIRRIKRNPKIARDVLESSGYACEMFPSYPIFTSKSSSKPYLEAHHLIPIGLQPKFETSLDVRENICILNPYAHKMVHHARYSEIEEHVANLATPRKDFLNSLKLSVDDVLRIYGRT